MSYLINILIVGFGGFIGATLRFLISGIAQKLSGSFPYGTLSVNLIGCLLIGLLGGYTNHINPLSPRIRLLIFIGILGSFTTFSSFGYETIILMRDKSFLAAFINLAIHMVVGLFLVFLGYSITVR